MLVICSLQMMLVAVFTILALVHFVASQGHSYTQLSKLLIAGSDSITCNAANVPDYMQ
jgi:hypothetical protein